MNLNKELWFPIPLFRLPFRVFFLLGAICGVIAVSFWILNWFGVNIVAPAKGLLWWHGHEMIFGFAGAVLVGFLLTAAKNWTGSEGVGGYRLVSLSLFWVFARLGFILSNESFLLAALIFETVFWLYAAYLLIHMLYKKKMWRNMIFAGILLTLCLLSWLSAGFIAESFSFVKAFHTAIFAFVLAVTVIAGRIIPFFTASALGLKKVEGIKVVEIPLILGTLFLLIYTLFIELQIQSKLIGIFFLVTVVLHFFRFSRWPVTKTFQNPMLWSLYLGYFLLILGLLQVGFFQLGLFTNLSAAFHSITIGAIGLLIFSMMSRVSLGHTGRTIKADLCLTSGFILLALSAVSRGLLVELQPSYSPVIFYAVSASLWGVAFTIWLFKFLPVLTKTRADNKPG